ncbi:MAG: alpha/beta hydrolase [Phycisphaeraceae bacterium]|nr:alpha/beta hydrolase [Phycisphaeraceae bacterium]
MQTETTRFDSDGLTLSGSFFLPEDHDSSETSPLVIPCSGFTGLCSIHPARFARFLTRRGHLCFGFDYRGFAESEGPVGRVLLEEQVRDIRHATSFAREDPRVDPDRIFLLGWGMGAGLVLDAARHLEGIAGLIAVNGFYQGDRVQRALRTADDYQRFVREVDQERCQRVRSGEARFVDPFEIYPLDEQSRRYVDEVLRPSPGYQADRYSYELAESLLRWNVEAHAPQMSRPLLIAHGDRNHLHPTDEAKHLHAAYGGPKQLFWLEGAGHTEFMDDEDPKFLALAEQIDQWLGQQLGDGA